MHSFIMNHTFGATCCDHINGNGLDNREVNIRIVTQKQNVWNASMRSTNRSGYAGVCLRPDTGKWRAYLMNEGKKVFLGQYDTAKEASAAREKAALAVYGEFMRRV